MIFNIPEWPADSKLTHYATTWVLTKDIDGSQVEDELDDSTTNLNIWEIDKLIPTGEIWYVKALRKLKDSDGNDINNDTWIGPKPVFNEKSNANEHLTPALYVSDPFIKDIAYVPGDKLTIEITEPKTNVAYIGTVVTLFNDAGKLVYEKTINFNDVNGLITIDNNDIDFSSIYKLGITLINVASHSTISKVVKDAYYLKKIFYTIDGNRTNLDANEPNNFKVNSTSEIGISVTKAEVLSIDNDVLIELKSSDNIIAIPPELKLNSSYKLKIYMTYVDNNGNNQDITDTIYITTMGQNEKFVYDSSYKYKNEVIKVSDVSDNVDNISDGMGNTEEFYTFVTPIKMSNGNCEMTVIDKTNNKLVKLKDGTSCVDGDYTIRLVTQSEGYIQSMDSDSKQLKLTNFTYDPFKDIITLGTTITTDIVSDTPVSRKVMEMADGLYLIGVNKDNDKQIDFYTLDLKSMVLTLKQSYTNDVSLTDISVCELSDTEVLILPKGDSAYRTIVYSINDNYATKGLSLPKDFKNKDIISFRLRNDIIVIFKLADSSDKLNFLMYDKEKYKITSKSVFYNGAGILEHFISTKSGKIFLLVNNKDNHSREFFKFH